MVRLRGRYEADRHGGRTWYWRVGGAVATARDVKDRYIEASVGIHLIDENLQEANNCHIGLITRECQRASTAVVDGQRYDRIATSNGIASHSRDGVERPCCDLVGIGARVQQVLPAGRAWGELVD